jgi:hypothetical protein
MNTGTGLGHPTFVVEQKPPSLIWEVQEFSSILFVCGQVGEVAYGKVRAYHSSSGVCKIKPPGVDAGGFLAHGFDKL